MFRSGSSFSIDRYSTRLHRKISVTSRMELSETYRGFMQGSLFSGRTRFQLLEFFLALTLFCFTLPQNAHSADKATLLETPRFTLYFPSGTKSQTTELGALAKSALAVLDATYEEISSTLKVQPKNKVVLRFLSPTEFHRHTRAPSWTSAMYLRGEISIPIASTKRVNMVELTRAIRHEYVHAVVSELSGKGCPAWIDEGLAQLFEGEPNPLLGPALRGWVAENEALPLTWLQNGFLTLNDELVPVAYAQSLFATRDLVRNNGFSAVQRYLDLLRDGNSNSAAFETAFGIDSESYEKRLTKVMRQWASSPALHP